MDCSAERIHYRKWAGPLESKSRQGAGVLLTTATGPGLLQATMAESLCCFCQQGDLGVEDRMESLFTKTVW